MKKASIREIKNKLSEYLRDVAEGNEVVITKRGKPVAVIVSPDKKSAARRTASLLVDDDISWNGEKPAVPGQRIKIKGKPLSDSVIEDRR
jgi:prevent-host-death family protein